MYLDYLSAKAYVKLKFGPSDDVVSHDLLKLGSRYAALSKDILTKYNAGDIVRQITPVCTVIPPWLEVGDKVITCFPFEDVTKENFAKYSEENFPNYRKLYTDGSKVTAPDVSVAAGLCDPEMGYTGYWRLHPEHSVVAAELYAIWKCLQYADMHTADSCIIFTDSRTSLQMILSKTKTYLRTLDTIRELLHRLNIDRVVMLHWVKAHIGIEGNERADEAANLGHSCDRSVLFGLHREEHCSIIHRGFTSFWHESWKSSCLTEGKGRFLRSLRDEVETESPVDTGERKMDSLIFRLRIGHVGVNKHLHRIKKSDTERCSFCGDVETVEHFLLDCDEYYDQREKLFVDIATIIRRPPTRLTLKLVLGGESFPLQINKLIIRALGGYLRGTGRADLL